MLRYKTKLYLV